MGTSAQIIELAKLSGIHFEPGSTYRPGATTKYSGSRSHHADDNAVDFTGYNQDQLAQFFMQFPTAEVIHKSRATGTWYGSSRGKPIDPVKNAQMVKDHENHLHVAMTPDQVGPGSVLDQIRKGLVSVGSLASGAVAPITGLLGSLIPNPSTVTQALSNVGTGISSVAESAMSIGRVADAITRALLPSNLMRGAMFMFGIMFLLIGIWFLAREAKESTP